MLCLRGQSGLGRDGKVSCGQGQGLPVLSVRRRVPGGAQADVGEIRGESASLLILADQTSVRVKPTTFSSAAVYGT